MSWWGVREFLWSATLLVVLGALFLARVAYVVLRTHNPRPATATRPRDGKASIAIFLGSGAYPSLFCNYSAHLEALHRRTHGGDDAPRGRHELDPVLDSNVPHLLRRLAQRRESTTTRGHYPHWLRALPLPRSFAHLPQPAHPLRAHTVHDPPHPSRASRSPILPLLAFHNALLPLLLPLAHLPRPAPLPPPPALRRRHPPQRARQLRPHRLVRLPLPGKLSLLSLQDPPGTRIFRRAAR